MPKLARQYDDRYYSSYRAVSNTSRTSSYGYSKEVYLDAIYGPSKIEKPQPKLVRRRKPKAKKKRSLLQCLVVLGVLGFVLVNALSYSFNNITRAMFVPTPYQEIQTDMYDLSFPTYNYLSNTWAFGHRGFNFSADEKNAQMSPLKENVKMPVLTQELMRLMENYKTVKPAVFVWDYDTQNYVDINASEIYATASIIKIPVLIDVFKSIEAGQMSLEDTMPLTEYYRTEGSGSLQFKAHNSEYTIDELANRMITESDNSATNMLMAKVGSMTDVNQAIRDWGLKDTYVQTWLPDLTGTNKTTARDMATMLYNIDENDKFLSPESRAKILNYMGHVHNNRLIHAGLGPGAVFLHKTGDIGKMLGDAGIVIAPNGKKYIVVILANRPHNSIAGKEFIVKASEIIYNYMVR
ncbi:serine hydrolase [bacterium]|nr:serine hydrolase [bacterium]